MLITTANDLPGYDITETLGEVFGLTVRSRNIGSQLGAGLKSVFGGELKGMTKALADSRQQVIDRMVEEAQAKGGDAIVAMRFDTSEMGNDWSEIRAPGTAFRTRRAGCAPLSSGENTLAQPRERARALVWATRARFGLSSRARL